MNPIALIKEWWQQHRDSRVERLDDGYIDVVILYNEGLVRAKGTGQSITDISAEVTSRVRKSLKVLIPHGTYFVSSSGHQNMVTRREYRLDLGPMTTKHISVPATCINANLPIPDKNAGFRGVARVSNDLRRFLEAAEGEDPMTVQTGAWAITDGYSGPQVQEHLRIHRSHGFGDAGHDAGSAVSDANITRARQLLAQLGIRNRL
jgi:hypothetical protein